MHPFISQNCSAIPASLVESTFFGTEKGSYTGAVSSKGLFELAQGGTLFLDEINSMDYGLQGKILKAIEDRQVRRIGGHELIPIDVRIVAAINEDPFTAIRAKRLRSDLFYRLNVNSIYLPPLKERKGDIDCVTDYYIDYYNQQSSRNISGLSGEARLCFNRYDWPGNLRELRNVIEGAFNLAESDRITLSDIPAYIAGGSQNSDQQQGWSYDYSLTFQQNLDACEKALLEELLPLFPSKQEAAKALGMSKQSLNYRISKAHTVKAESEAR